MCAKTGNKPRVTVLDSGVGGLSVCREIVRRVPGVELTYVGDNAAFPYGTRPNEKLRDRVVHLARHLFERDQPQLLVLACNTASTIALNAVRAAVPVPVVGVVPAIKPAVAHSRTRSIGLLGTPTTVASAYTDALIRRFATDCRVVRLGSTELATWAEAKMAGQPPDPTAMARIIAPFSIPPVRHRWTPSFWLALISPGCARNCAMQLLTTSPGSILAAPSHSGWRLYCRNLLGIRSARKPPCGLHSHALTPKCNP